MRAAQRAAKAASPAMRASAPTSPGRYQQPVLALPQRLREAAEARGDHRPAMRDGEGEHAARLDLVTGEDRDRAGAEQPRHLLVGDEAGLVQEPVRDAAVAREGE